MSGADFWFGTVPWALTIGAVLALLYRLFTRPLALDQAERRRPTAWPSLPLTWGLGLILAGHALGVLLPDAIAGWNSAPARLYVLEGTGLALGAWLLIGLLGALHRFANDPDQPRITVADVVVALGAVFLATSGVLIALSYRWGSYWGAEVVAPYLRSIFSSDPRPELLAGLPWLVQAHALAFFAVLFAFPFSRWMAWLEAPAGAVRRFVASLVSPPSGSPAGTWTTWGTAVARAVIIVVYFVVFTVIVPAGVVDRLGDVPEVVRDVVVGGVWLGFVGLGLAGLWWGQKRARI